jgi:hypothetical protein
VLITTEKDWVKVAECGSSRTLIPPVWRLDMQIRFKNDDDARLFAQLNSVLRTGR